MFSMLGVLRDHIIVLACMLQLVAMLARGASLDTEPQDLLPSKERAVFSTTYGEIHMAFFSEVCCLQWDA